MSILWKVIAESRVGYKDIHDQCNVTKQILEKLSDEDLISFTKEYSLAESALYNCDLWDAVTPLSKISFVSDDGFSDFIAWVVFQWEQFYTDIVANPDNLSKISNSQLEECLYAEWLGYVYSTAYEDRFWDNSFNVIYKEMNNFIAKPSWEFAKSKEEYVSKLPNTYKKFQDKIDNWEF